MIEANVPHLLRDAVNRELADGESIVWLEQPDPILYQRFTGITGIFLGIVGSAGALYLVAEGITGNLRVRGVPMSTVDALIWSVPILLIAMTSFAWPLYYRRTARNFAYAITNRRVVTVERGFLGDFDSMSFSPETLAPRLKLYRDGVSGEIELVANRRYDDHTASELYRLTALRDARATEAALNNLIQSSSNSSL